MTSFSSIPGSSSSSSLQPAVGNEQVKSNARIKKSTSEKKLERDIIGPNVKTTYSKLKAFPPYTFGNLTTKKADEILQNAAEGSWIIGYRGKDQALTVFKKMNGKIVHKSYEKASVNQLKAELGKKNMIVPKAFKENINNKLKKFWEVHSGIGKGAKIIDEGYRAEVIDKKHRYGGTVLAGCFEIWKNSNSKDSFNDWLTKIQVGSRKVPGFDQVEKSGWLDLVRKLPSVDFFSGQERGKHLAHVDEQGKIYSKKYDTNNGKDDYTFVISPEGKVYMGRHIAGKEHHSSFLKGNAVLSAGKLVVDKGQVLEISDRSGHYKTTHEMIVKAVKEFENRGVDLSKTKIVINTSSWEPLKFKPKNLDAQVKLTEAPEFFGDRSRVTTEKLLQGKEKGTWLIRYSANQEVNVVSRITQDGKPEHIILRDQTLEELKDKYGADKLLSPI